MTTRTTFSLTAIGSGDYVFDESDEHDLINDLRAVLEDYFDTASISIEEVDTETID